MFEISLKWQTSVNVVLSVSESFDVDNLMDDLTAVWFTIATIATLALTLKP